MLCRDFQGKRETAYLFFYYVFWLLNSTFPDTSSQKTLSDSGKMVYADIVFNPLSFENGPSKPGIQEGPKKSQKWISQTASKRQLKIAFFGIFDNFGAY